MSNKEKRNISKASIVRDIQTLLSEKDKEISELKSKVHKYKSVLGGCDLDSDSVYIELGKLRESMAQLKRDSARDANFQTNIINALDESRAKLYTRLTRLQKENDLLRRNLKEKPQNQPDE